MELRNLSATSSLADASSTEDTSDPDKSETTSFIQVQDLPFCVCLFLRLCCNTRAEGRLHTCRQAGRARSASALESAFEGNGGASFSGNGEAFGRLDPPGRTASASMEHGIEMTRQGTGGITKQLAEIEVSPAVKEVGILLNGWADRA